MHRFFLPPNQCTESKLWLETREARHATQVLRLKIGDPVTVLDGAGHEFACDITQVSKREVMLTVTGKKFHPPLPTRLTLIQAVPKGKTFDVIVQKATELGAFRVVPLLTERVATRLDKVKDAAQKVDKWRQVAIESIKQCGSPWLPEISAPVTFGQYLTGKESYDLSLVAALAGARQHPRKFFEVFHREHQRLPKSIRVWVGPEGDFTPAELAGILASGAMPITLGSNVLRAETAAIYCLSVLNYELQM
jgi:16S rRNA (uracil1498-N3)-methyltransferase